ncbi:MAG: hypothetical protein J0L63_15045 [Anaerolineae bacterium]|nr:hypothetical protein [Anaerolineae bacterium]
MLRFVFLLLLIVVSGILPLHAQTTTPADIIAACAALLPPDRPLSLNGVTPTLRLVQPVAGVHYGTAVNVRIEATNFDVTTEGRHWHLWVNGQLQGMVYQPDAIIDLEPGTYTLCVSLGNTDHADIAMPDGVVITVERPLAGTPTAVLTVSREQAQIQPEPVIEPAQLMLLIGGGLLAAFGGWWLGTRLGKRKSG